MSTAIGDIIIVDGRRERVVERVPIPDHSTGEILYYALKSEPLEEEAPADAGQ